jgi:uncharacterized protein DUF6206
MPPVRYGGARPADCGTLRIQSRSESGWTAPAVLSASACPMDQVPVTAQPRPSLEVDVERLDATVEDAIRVGSPRGLRVLGYGELTLVIGWPTEKPVVAVKRLPPFSDRCRLDGYTGLLERYVEILRERGISVVHTEIRSHAGSRGSMRAYLVQPLVPRERHLNVILQNAEEAHVRKLFERIVESVHGCADDMVGFDAQAANWWVENGELGYFDISTPMLRDRDAHEQLDVALFLSVYPWITRPVLARIAPGVMAQFHDVHTVLLDFASNLHKEGLERCVPVLLQVANARLEHPLTAADVRRYFRQDKLLWALMQRLRLADRGWQRHVRRRPYPLLLPSLYRYGPPRRTKEHS